MPGTRKANCPSLVGTTWKPPYSFIASGEACIDETLLEGVSGAEAAVICAPVCAGPGATG